MTTQTTDPFMVEGGPAITFPTLGDVHSIIVRSVEKKIDTDFATKKALTWENGDPKHVFVFSGEDADGDPISLWVRGNMVKAIREATTAAGLKSVVDTKVTIKYEADGVATKGNPPKLYKAKVEKVAAAVAFPHADYPEEEPF